MKNKEQLIAEFLSQPIEVGDAIEVQGLGSRDKTIWGGAIVSRIDGDKLWYKTHQSSYEHSDPILISAIRRSIRHIGPNPFKPSTRHNAIQVDISSLFHHFGFDMGTKTYKHEIVEGIQIPEACFSPTVIDSDGKEVEFQRGLVWGLEQKQLLIESIYNQIDIGKFVVRLKSWEHVVSRINKGLMKHTAFRDVVDGKQRFHTLIEFVSDGFKDMSGNLYSELSGRAQTEFLKYRNVQFVEMPESSTDKDVLDFFLALNFAGIPMSKEHIEYVKSINI